MNITSHTYKLGEAGQLDDHAEWVLQAVLELLELHSGGALPSCADPSPAGTPGIMGRLDSHGSPSPGLTVGPGHVWSQNSKRNKMCYQYYPE